MALMLAAIGGAATTSAKEELVDKALVTAVATLAAVGTEATTLVTSAVDNVIWYEVEILVAVRRRAFISRRRRREVTAKVKSVMLWHGTAWRPQIAVFIPLWNASAAGEFPFKAAVVWRLDGTFKAIVKPPATTCPTATSTFWVDC
jgi:hypothetical protein